MKPNGKQLLEHWSLAKPLTPFALSTLFCLPTCALAQEEPSVKSSIAFEEVVVTARRKSEDLQTVPISVTAMSADYLRENNITELSEIANHVPSLEISVAGTSTNTPIISLRGQRPSESLITIDPAVPLYFADVALTPTQGTNISMYDLSNVQVLKGPQGMLFGKSSTGGAVLFTPTAPGDEFGGYIETKVGDYDLLGIEGAVDVPITDSFRLRFAGLKLDRDGYQDNVADNELAGKEKYWDDHPEALRVSIAFEPTDSFQNLTVLDWSTNDMQSRVPTILGFNGTGDCSFCTTANELINETRNIDGVVYPWDNAYNDAIERQRNRSWQEVETDYDAREKVTNEIAANTTTIDINDNLSIKNILAYRRLDFKYNYDTDGTALAAFGSWANGRGVGDLFAVTYADDYERSIVESEQWSDELQFLINGFDDRLEMIVGLYYFDMEGTQSQPVQLAPTLDLWRQSPRGDASNQSQAIFSEGTFDVSSEFALTLGLRYTEDDRNMTAKNLSLDPNGDPYCLVEDPNGDRLPIDNCARTVEESFSATTWRVIGTFTPEDAMMYYASISTGYRPGGFNLRADESFQFESFDQEEVLNYEIGSKIDWDFDSGIVARMNIALYWQDYTDIQKTQGDSRSSTGFGTSTINATSAVVRGGDLEFMLLPTEGLTLALSYSYVDAYYDDEWIAPNPVTGLPQDQSDYDFLHIPRYSGTASIAYLLPLDPSLGDITMKLNYYFQSKVTRFEDIQGEFSYPGIDNGPLNDARVDEQYDLLDFRIDWANVLSSDFDTAIWVKNIEDTVYNTGGLIVPDSIGLVAATYGAPRTVGASLRYRF